MSDQDQDVECKADPGTDDSRLRAEGQFVERVTLDSPGLAEADVRETDGAPGEDGAETTERQHPRKRLVLFARGGEESQEAQGGSEKDGKERSAATVDVGEDPGGHALFGQSGERTRRAKDRGVAHREDGNHDDDVHDRVETRDTRVGDCEDERRSFGVGGGSAAKEARVVVRDKQANERQGDNVEEGNPPEHLLDSCWEGLARIGCLGGGKAYQLGPCKREGGGDESGTETFEAMVEGARVVPVFAADIATLGSATAVEDDSEDAARWVSCRTGASGRIS